MLLWGGWLVAQGQTTVGTVTAVAISVGAAAVGASFSPINPFQVQIAQKLAGYSLGKADNLRKAMGKKSREVMSAARAAFG